MIGVETRDGSPSEITLGFTLTRAFPEVSRGDIHWTYTRTNSVGETVSQVIHTSFNDTKFDFTDDLLRVTITKLSLFDAGHFTMTATNEAGTHNASVQLIIHGETIKLCEWIWEN